MTVLEDQHQRRVVAQALDQGQEPGPHRLDERRFVGVLGQVERQSELEDEFVHLVGSDEGARQRPELLDRRDRMVGFDDAGGVADHGGHRRERGAIAEPARPALERDDVIIETRHELVGQPRLADARFPHHREQGGSVGDDHASEPLAEHAELMRPADDRDGSPYRTRAQAFDGERDQPALEPLRGDVPALAEAHGCLDERTRRGAHDHLAGFGSGLQARCRVDHGTGDEQLPGGPHAGGGFARFDAHPHLELRAEPRLRREPSDARTDREPCADGAHGVVLVDLREAEHRHDGVADELLRPSTEGLELFGGGVVEASDHIPGALGIQTLRQARGVDQVGEQDRDHLALLGPHRGRDEGTTRRAEAGVVRQRRAAHGADHPQSIRGRADRSMAQR